MAATLVASPELDAGNRSLAGRILSISRRLASVDEVFSFFSPRAGAPAILGSASTLRSVEERTGRYAGEFYRDDPIKGMRRAAGSHFTRHVLSADDIKRSDYREICFDRPMLRQKICFEQSADDGRVVCNFYLRRPVGAALLQRLEELAAIALPSLSRLAEARSCERASLVSRIEARLATAYGELTLRERQVCARTIAGWSSDAIAIDLGVGAGTVLTYRRRAYGRYDYSSAGEFLEKIVN
jgi:DNA-binding CsgD family transcriptional regulator